MLVILTMGCILALTNGKVLSSVHLPLQGYQIWKVSKVSQEVMQAMETDGLVDILDHSTGHTFAVAPQHMSNVSHILRDHKVDIEVAVQDLDQFLKDQDVEDQKLSRRRQLCTASNCPAPLTDDYMSLQQIEYYLDHINQTYPDRVTVTSIGKSYENRDIWMVHIKAGRCDTNRNTWNVCKAPTYKPKSIWLEGGIHAREWISPSVVLQMIDRFLNDCETTRNYDVYVAPCVNPDGYEYSRTSNRLQRKNRSPNSRRHCPAVMLGVDLNRNWGYKRGDEGTSSNPCSEVYKGESAFSEPETIALRDAMTQVQDLQLYLSFHSFKQVLLLPWGWTRDRSVINSLPDKEEMEHLADVFVSNTIARHGTNYYHTNAAVGLKYVAMGTSHDWAKGSLGVKYAYTLELRDKGTYGFLLPRNQILPTGQEVWDGLKSMLAEMIPRGKGCNRPSISCTLAGGSCIRSGEDCDGTLDPMGCRLRCCKCCIPDNKCKGQEVWDGLKNMLDEMIPRDKGCDKPTISCTLAGGSCIRSGEDCDGTLDPNGCRGRYCKCCIPENKCKVFLG